MYGGNKYNVSVWMENVSDKLYRKVLLRENVKIEIATQEVPHNLRYMDY